MAYVTIFELKNYLDISVEDDDIILTACIDRAEAAIETYTNRDFEASTATKYYGWDAVDGLYLWLDDDLYSLTSIANGDSDSTAIATANVTLWPRNQGPPYTKIRLNDGANTVWQIDTDYWITIIGTWGYSSTPSNDVKQAALRWAAYMYRQIDTGDFETVALAEAGIIAVQQGVPQDVRVLLDPHRRFSL